MDLIMTSLFRDWLSGCSGGFLATNPAIQSACGRLLRRDVVVHADDQKFPSLASFAPAHERQSPPLATTTSE